ncbi:MAG: hypothetical protein LIP02_00600, partial [Bacteroidales bacterium]|nr:hypothetical protein [Bacteroidales bacterium]
MRIIMPTFERIKWMPPTITLINLLAKMGYEIIYVTIYPDDYYPNFDCKRITNKYLCKKERFFQQKLKYSHNLERIGFRLDNITKLFFGHRLSRWLKNNLRKEDILWIVNEMTPLFAGWRFSRKYKGRFIFSIYELHSKCFSTRHVWKTARNAAVVVEAEYNRAHIAKCWYGVIGNFASSISANKKTA